jgi:hypothetical protein
VVVLIISIPAEFIIYALIGLLFFSPLMAFFYLYTCNKELKSYQGEDASNKITADDGGNAGSPPDNDLKTF